MKAGITYRYESKVLSYEDAVRDAGFETMRLAPGSPSLDGLDALVLTGGSDVNPARYGQEPHAATDKPDDERDDTEAALLSRALSDGVPVLAICRGLQLWNVVAGGTLVQDLATSVVHERKAPQGTAPGMHPAVHPVDVVAGTLLAGVVGAGECPVNSRHHQAVDRLGTGLTVSAVAPDGVVEAFELPGHPFAVAVQWHPEDRFRASERDRSLFAALARAAHLQSR
jgi:putative glutamine amidotransferase